MGKKAKDRGRNGKASRSYLQTVKKIDDRSGRIKSNMWIVLTNRAVGDVPP